MRKIIGSRSRGGASRHAARLSGPGYRSARERGGFTILEGLLAFTVLTLAVGGVTSTLVETSSLMENTQETILASHAAQSVLEGMTGDAFEDLFRLYNADPTDDPGSPGDGPGNGFAVPGLTPIPGDPDGVAGEIILPEAGGQLREDLVVPALSLPRDLNADGIVDAADHAADYVVLPVIVRVEWTGVNGNRAIEFMTVLADL